MAALTFLDTHVVAWLYSGFDELLSSSALDAMDEATLRISPMVVLELEYLHEIGRLSLGGDAIATALAAERGIQRDPHPFGSVVREALTQTWTRDPFDRMIAAHAVAAGGSLVTKDERMLANVTAAIW